MSKKPRLPGPAIGDASRCPLCGGANDCQLCTADAYKGPCWCMSISIPEGLLSRVPPESRNRRCICRRCVESFDSNRSQVEGGALQSGDYYFDSHNLMVLTADYLKRRGYCCGNGCRHCPYP